MNEFLLGFLCGTSALLCFFYGKNIWWTSETFKNSLETLSTNWHWKVFGLCLSFYPLICALPKLQTDMAIGAFILGLVVSHYWLHHTLNQSANSAFGGFFLLIIWPPSMLFTYGNVIETLPLKRTLDKYDSTSNALFMIASIVATIAAVEHYKKHK